MIEKNWYVLRTKNNREDQVDRYLSAQGIETYYPTLKVEPVNPRASRIQPYFPCYLFIYVDLKSTVASAMNWVPGTVGLVEFGNQPAPVSDLLIEQIRERIAQVMNTTLDDYQPGDPVIVQRGALAGRDAIFDTRLSGHQRVQILLHILGRPVKASVNARDIRKRLVGTP